MMDNYNIKELGNNIFIDRYRRNTAKKYNVICLTGSIPLYEFNLNIVINDGKYAFCGEEAEDFPFTNIF